MAQSPEPAHSGSLPIQPGEIRDLNILDNISDAVVVFDSEWRCIYANAPGIAMSRLEAGTLIGGAFWELFPELLETVANTELRRAMDERVRVSFELWYAPYKIWVQCDAHPTPGGVTLFVRDITAAKQALRDQQLAEERFRVALQSSPTVVFNQDTDLVYTWVSNALPELSSIDWIGRSDDALGHWAQNLTEWKRSVLATGQASSRELLLEVDGLRRWYEFHVRPLRDDKGVITGLTGSATDVTAQRQSQARIHEQERELRLVIDSVPALVAYIDRDFRYRFINRRYSEWFRREPAEIEGHTLLEAFGPELWKAAEPRLRQALSGQPVSYVLHMEYPDKKRWVRANYVPDYAQGGEVRGAVILVQDITDTHEAEEELRRNEEQYRFLANALPQMVWVGSAAGVTQFLNDHWYEYTGATREEGIEAFARAVPQNDAVAIVAKFQAGQASRLPFEIEHRIRRGSDGAERWHLSRIKPVFGGDGEIVQWIGTSVDIHDRKASEVELRQARRDLTDILESISESFIAVDRDWRFVYVNAEVARRLNIPREELIGRGIWDTVAEEVKEAFYPKYRQVMEERIPKHFEVMLPPDRWYDAYAHPTEAGMSAYITDKTEQKRTEEALRRKAKLESVGLLAGGIAHDFNNLLVGILGAAGLAEQTLEADRPEREMLRLITGSAQRAADLTRQMLAYAGKSQLEKQSVNVNAIISDTTQLLRVTASPGIRLDLELAPELPALIGDPGQIQQVVLNLLTNALEAIPPGLGGGVRVRTALHKEMPERTFGMNTLSRGDYVEVEVTDSGRGITRDVLDRIFDPFFTTKFAGRGLGLAAVQGIVRTHEGGIDVHSVPERGTTFRVLLRAAEIPGRSEELAASSPRMGSGTVLVIDDEPAVRLTSQRMLVRHGYTALVADSGRAGIEMFRNEREALQAVLLDVSMPDLSGFEVLRRLAGELSGIRVVMSSGHGRHDIDPELAKFPGVRFLRKPYRTEELMKVLQEE